MCSCVCREGELEELFNSVFAGMNAAAADSRKPSDSFSAGTSAASKTQASTAARKKRKKRR